MNRSDFANIVTVGDLEKFRADLLMDISRIMKHDNREFYTPKEFADITGLKYDVVIKRCREGIIPATQPYKNGAWLIPRAEIDKIREEAYKWASKKDNTKSY